MPDSRPPAQPRVPGDTLFPPPRPPSRVDFGLEPHSCGFPNQGGLLEGPQLLSWVTSPWHVPPSGPNADTMWPPELPSPPRLGSQMGAPRSNSGWLGSRVPCFCALRHCPSAPPLTVGGAGKDERVRPQRTSGHCGPGGQGQTRHVGVCGAGRGQGQPDEDSKSRQVSAPPGSRNPLRRGRSGAGGSREAELGPVGGAKPCPSLDSEGTPPVGAGFQAQEGWPQSLPWAPMEPERRGCLLFFFFSCFILQKIKGEVLFVCLDSFGNSVGMPG